ncbi:hypothetical protein BI311_25370 [Xanthomonas citri pv. citri]|nr:hypothetical protein BI311_25370 [Xanthomonas citri pv. citri]
MDAIQRRCACAGRRGCTRATASRRAGLRRTAALHQCPGRQSAALRAARPGAGTAARVARAAASGRSVQRRPWQHDLATHLLPWHARAWPLLSAPHAMPPLWTHGDWHASNLLWETDHGATEVSAIFDFGLSDRCSALFDLATAIERNLIPWLQLDAGARAQAQLQQLDALLDGYALHRPLSATQLRCLAALLPIVHADFALSEIEYFAAITHSPDNVDTPITAICSPRGLVCQCRWSSALAHLHARAALLQ